MVKPHILCRHGLKVFLLHSTNKTASRYVIKNIQGTTYMFLEWKSGDYSFKKMTPMFYVMKKESNLAQKGDEISKGISQPVPNLNNVGR